jgi:hypothetical protein
MSVRLSAYISAAPTGQISVKFEVEDFYKKSFRNPNLVKIGQKYVTLCIKTREVSLFVGEIKLP